MENIKKKHNIQTLKAKLFQNWNDATYNKDYLTGRYGAIPVLEEFIR